MAISVKGMFALGRKPLRNSGEPANIGARQN
jgi:hypothetical protein